jgi:hypothetical protein
VLLFLENNYSQGSVRKPVWQRRRTRFLVSAVAIALLIILAFEGISLFWIHPTKGSFVSFACTSSSNNSPEFVVNANVYLADGMDQDEAMEVASIFFLEVSQHSVGQPLQLLSTNLASDGKGIWTAKFTLEASVHEGSRTYGGNEATPHALRVYFIMINPYDQTIRYDENPSN